MAEPTYRDLNFSYLSNRAMYFKAFCVDPADHHCDLGVCPNADVTGIGQQISSEWFIFTFPHQLLWKIRA